VRIRLNGKDFEEDPGSTVAALLQRLGAGEDPVAVAVNGDVVPRAEHGNRVLREGDEVEVIHAVAGG
jgi:sulfur carrier protein